MSMSVPGTIALKCLGAYSRIAPTERGGYRLVRWARRLIPPAQWRGRFRTPDGLVLDLDLRIYPDCCMAVGLYELDSLRVLRRRLRAGGWFVDCGANLGYFTMLAARLVGPHGRVDAYEPDPLNRQRFEQHLQLNGLAARVSVHPLAVADTDATLTLYHPVGAEHNHGQASLFGQLLGEFTCYQVQAVRLDEHLARLSDAPRTGTPDLIKLDIEGAECSAIAGMAGLLQSDRPPILMVEHNPVSAAASGHRPGDVWRLVRSIRSGYRCWWIGSTLHRVRDAAELDRFTRQVNLLMATE